MRILSCVS